MAALHSSALQQSLQESVQIMASRIIPPPLRKSAFSLTHPPPSLSLSWSSSPRNVQARASAVAVASSVDITLESEMGISYQKLQEILAAGEWELADEETRRLIIVLAGENAVQRKYVFFSEVQFMPKADLATIDRLWRTYSNGKFGYSVQRKIMKRVEGDCTEFFKKVEWMKPLNSESRQYMYCSFPTEFMWELASSTPNGHLPLTNALRGTRLLKCLLDHPAFDFADAELQVPSVSSPSPLAGNANASPQQQQQQQKKPLSMNYSF